MIASLLLGLFLAPQEVSTAPAATPSVDRWSEARASVPESQRKGFDFLLEHMPASDRENLSVELVLENIDYAYRAWQEAPWHGQISESIFLNEILPYANINERRDRWRKDFYERFQPWIAEAKSPSEAAAILNQKLFPEVGVIYSTKRPKADQSPYESIEAGMASCTGLSVLLIDACRAVGVPARFVGTPLWADGSGNHSWVEVWDQGWHFTGAGEPTGMDLNKAWFTDRASKAIAGDRDRAIYAVSFRKTAQHLPMVWKPEADTVYAVNVTSHYTPKQKKSSDLVRLRIRAHDGQGKRLRVPVKIMDKEGNDLFQGETRDDSFDANDHLFVELPYRMEIQLYAETGVYSHTHHIYVPEDGSLLDLAFGDDMTGRLLTPQDLLWEEHKTRLLVERAKEMEAKELSHGELRFRFAYKTFGEAPEGGHSLYISMHGGGGDPAEVNDQQWENQKRLYEPKEGIYLAPRASTDTWNLWHQAHIDVFLDRLIENMIVFEGVNPDRVYLMGYSAGGDGVYQLAPRMADRFAAAAMMAGHPNDAKPDSLYNLPFTLHMGAEDGAYDRNKVAAEWGKQLKALRQANPDHYDHWVKLHEGKGHWMDRQDADAVPWMADRTRTIRPHKIVWLQDDVTHSRFYWLKVEEPKARTRVVVSREDNVFTVESAQDLPSLTIRMDAKMVDFAQDIVVRHGESELFRGKLQPSMDMMRRSLQERGDPAAMWSAEVTVELPQESD